MDEYSREPCPWRIVEDCGGAFAVGAIGGSLFQAIKGFRNSPAGMSHRMTGSMAAIKAKAPVIGGSFAVWGALFSTVDCTLIKLRRKEDPWNSIISGAASGGILRARSGVGMMIRGAVIGGVLLAMIEGVGIYLTRMSADQFRPLSREEQVEMQRQMQNQDPNNPMPNPYQAA